MYASGYIAGDALMGVLATFLIYIGTGVDLSLIHIYRTGL